MNFVMSDSLDLKEESVRFYPEVFAVVSTLEGTILECQLDIMVHEFTLDNSEVLFTYKPINPEILVNGRIEHISNIYSLRPSFPVSQESSGVV